jgi:hypothetical protein
MSVDGEKRVLKFLACCTMESTISSRAVTFSDSPVLWPFDRETLAQPTGRCTIDVL